MSADFHSMMRHSVGNQAAQLQVTYGELLAYDPATHTAQFELPMHRPTDNNNNTSNAGIPTGFIQCGTMFTGPGYGMQFHPPVGAQALIIFVDLGRMLPLAAVFLANDVENPPFADGKSHGWKDENGSSHTTTTDGATEGDGAGAARSFGAKYTETSTTSGHTFSQDDVARQVRNATAAGHFDLFDDAGRVISRQTAGGLQSIHSDVTSEIAHIAPNVALGARLSSLGADNALFRHIDANTLATNINNLRRDDLVKFAAAMVAADITNAGAVIAQLASLVGITVPSGSSVVKAI